MKKRLNLSLLNNHLLDTYVTNNFNKLRLNSLLLPFFLLLLIAFFLYLEDAFSVDAYIQIQKDSFLYLNSKLSKFPNLQFNLTQLGDVIIFLPFLTIFIVYASKLWESLLTSLVICCVISNLFKKLFSVPRPAAVLDNDSFVIIGKALFGNTSLPSGHSIATFTILASILIAFMPKKVPLKIVWGFFILITGLIIAFTRVGVGAHYPLDVIIGSALGYISALTGILINKKFNPWSWIKNKKYYFIFILLFSIWAIGLIIKIVDTNLVIFYFSLVSLITTLFIITPIYVKKKY
ncbi:MAG: phosphoesterase [Lutibacter sp.]|nr:MAG: phosphoesterase [Lutibacter sp.]